jgi:amino acid adenylation domain-containing protein
MHEQRAEQLAIEEARTPFDLTTAPMIRTSLLHLDADDYTLLLTMHHIASDGWSMGVLVAEFAACYAALTQGEQPDLPTLPIQYVDYAAWQREWLQGDVLKQQLTFWSEQLDGCPPLLELPTDRPRPAIQSDHGATKDFMLPGELSTQITALSQREGATLFMTLLAAFQVLLARYSGQDDIVVGTPIANRTQHELEGLIGFFVNTLALRTDLSDAADFLEVLRQVRQTALDAYAHQDLPFELLVETLQPERNLSHTPLFQVMFVLNNEALNVQSVPGLQIDILNIESQTARFDMTLSMQEGPDGLSGTLEYNTDLFDAATIERFIGHFQQVLTSIVDDPEQPLETLPLLTDAEYTMLIDDWNATESPFPAAACFHELVEAWATQQPDAPALIFEEQTLSYQQLDQRANQLAHHLQQLNVQPDTLVGIAAHRSCELVVAMLGVLKAGGAFLPLDPTYPSERLAFMLSDAQAPVLITQAELLADLTDHAAQVVCIDRDWPTIAQQPTSQPASAASADTLAYCIYTSGSTGQPKGTLLAHRGLCNLATFQREHFALAAGKRVLQFSALSFDAAVWETAMALGSGATLVLAPAERLAAGAGVLNVLQQQRITHVTLPPSLLAVLDPEPLPDLERIVVAGEACPVEVVQRWAPGRHFYNAYGPTETTVCASIYTCDPATPISPPIGRPLPNMQLYVLDTQQQPVPVGVSGELYIGGVGVARGYHNRPDLTAERFVPDPFSNEPRARLYRTGDRVRYRADGNLEFLGRLDQQVKLRGFRIELGEIASVLRQHPAIQDSTVLLREKQPGNPRLVAYLITPEAPTREELRTFLRQTLPEYMVPAAFVALAEWPLTPSGKVDRAALPDPEQEQIGPAHEYVAPRTATEEALARISAELLHIERVGIFDNFFEVGGHSLLATQFISRVRETLNVELPLRSIFEHPTVAELAEAIDQMTEQASAAPAPAIVPLAREARRVKRSELTSGRSKPNGHSTRDIAMSVGEKISTQDEPDQNAHNHSRTED